MLCLRVARVQPISSKRTNNLTASVRTGNPEAYMHLENFAVMMTKARGFVSLMYIDAGYLEMAKSFICNLSFLNPKYLDQLAIITHGPAVATELRRFRAQLNIFDFNDIAPGQERSRRKLFFGQYEYFIVTLRRLRIQSALIQQGANVFVIEADAMWFSPSVYDTIRKLLETSDFITANDRGLEQHGDKLVSAGFLATNSTASSRKFFSMYIDTYERKLLHVTNKSGTIDLPGEQVYMTHLLQKASHLKVEWLDPCMFVCGKWYMSSSYRESCPNPLVLQNNWITGVDKKIQRAKRFHHWFLSLTGECLIQVGDGSSRRDIDRES